MRNLVIGLLTRALKQSFELGYTLGRVHGYVDTLDELLYSDDPHLIEAGRRISPFISTGGGSDAAP